MDAATVAAPVAVCAAVKLVVATVADLTVVQAAVAIATRADRFGLQRVPAA